MKNWNWTKNDHQNNGQSNLPTQASRGLANSMSYLTPLSSFYLDVNRMFDKAFQNFGMPSVLADNAFQNMMFNPSVDISSNEKEYTVEVETPGMNENDIRLDITRDGDLCICGEKRQENDNQEKDFHRVERAYGSFSRTLSLPDDIDKENINASFHNGVLTISIPRVDSGTSQMRRIEINENGFSSRNNGGNRNRQEDHQNERPKPQENKQETSQKQAK